MNLKALWFMFQTFSPPPIFIIPGLGGSIIYNKITKEEIWPPKIQSMLYSDIFLSNFNVTYKNKEFIPNTPSEVGPIGDTKHIKVVRNWMIPFIKHNYFHTFLNFFHLKYPRYEIQSIPYDFRIIANKNVRLELYDKMQKSIETKVSHENKKAVIIAHSLGGLVLHDFLHQQTPLWKTQNIDKIITINTPYIGSIKALAILLGKGQLSIPIVKKIDYIKNISSFLWLIPNPNFYVDRVLDNEKNITIVSIRDLLGEELWERVQYHFNDEFKNIGIQNDVQTHIIYSSNIPTQKYLNKDSQISVDGDGLIDSNSLTFPRTWKNQKLVHLYPMKNYDHTIILNSPELMQLLMKILKKK